MTSQALLSLGVVLMVPCESVAQGEQTEEHGVGMMF
jgi:hypothetical protein